MLKAGLAGGAMLAMGAWFTGALDTGYSRVVQRPQADVMAALADLDITAQPGAPGTDPARAGGVAPTFRLARGANAMTWYVMSGDQVATRMTATFEPLNGGAETRVRTSVERGDAPDDRVSPAFRSNGITLGLFSMAVEGELNRLTAPVVKRLSAEECQDIFMRHMAGVTNEGRTLGEAVGRTAATVMKMAAAQDSMRRAGCDVDSPPGEFKPVSDVMRPADPRDAPPVRDRDPDAPTFVPGKPMVDVSRR